MLDHLPDIASDLSRFHRIDDANELEAPVFFALARRLPAYGGVLSGRLRADPAPASAAPDRPLPTRTPTPPQPAAPSSDLPPVTPALLQHLNAQSMQLGGGSLFSVALIGPDDGGGRDG